MHSQAAQGTGGPAVVLEVPQAPTGVGPGGQVVIRGPASPRAIYEGLRHQRSELRDQLDDLENQRQDITRQMQALDAGPNRAGLEQRLAQVDQRIVAMDKQIADAEASLANAAAIPGAVVPTPPPRQSGPPEEFWVIAGLILVPSAFILTVAYARRIWRRGAKVVSEIPQALYDRFARVEQAVDSVAVEVERIGEGQRYLTRVLAERQLGPGAAQPVEVRQREGERVASDRGSG